MIYLSYYLGFGILTLILLLADDWRSKRKTRELSSLLTNSAPQKDFDYYLEALARWVIAPFLAVIAWPYALLVLGLSLRRERRNALNRNIHK